MLAMLTFALIFTRRKALKDDKLRILHAIAVYYIPLSIIVGWLSYYPSMSRIVFFLEPIIIVLLTYAVWEARGKLFRVFLIKPLVISIVLFFSITMLMRNLTWAHALPYDTVFSKEYSEARKN